ncbi:MAG: FliG C-terminal domain-containing protein [Bacteriovoracaceae bacterium]
MSEKTPPQQQGYFINGKAQIIEMLEHMTPDERDTLIRNVRMRNPQLASELLEKSTSFRDLDRLSDRDLLPLVDGTNPKIMGLALKTAPVSFQRRVLSLADRNYAEEAYAIMNQRYANERRDATRAQNKILSSFAQLVRSKRIGVN